MNKIQLELSTLKQLYLEEKLTQKEVAIRMGTSERTLRRTFRLYHLYKKTGEHKDSTGHILVYQPKHPRARDNGYVMRAIIVWEETNGIPFPNNKEPHHDNGVPDDDRIENIIPLTHGKHTTISNQRRRKL